MAIASLALLTLSSKASAADPTAQGGMVADMPTEKSAAPSHFGHTHVPASAAAPGHFGHTHLPTSPVKSQLTDAAEPMLGMAMPDSGAPMAAMPASAMKMGAMTGGAAPSDARDPDAYAEGYEYTSMPGMEHTDLIAFRTVRIDELEFLSGNGGEGFAWSAQANYGGPSNKLWLRTQGLKTPGELDPTTGGEALWWRPYTAFWGTQLGVRQDFGTGARTWLAAGVEGLAPYWFNVEATGYVGDDGRLSARLRTAYDLRFTNRLILVPSGEANAYSKAENRRGVSVVPLPS